jgi:hypothetical protein
MKKELTGICESGSEPMRNMFSCARVLFCDDDGLPKLVKNISIFQ